MVTSEEEQLANLAGTLKVKHFQLADTEQQRLVWEDPLMLGAKGPRLDERGPGPW